MACGLGVIKAILCTVNVTIALLGVAAIVVGAIVLNNRNLHDVNDHLEQFSNYPTAATVALVAGVTVLLFGFCGCCGACFGVGWILLMFMITMVAFVIVETVAIGLVWKYANTTELENTLTATLLKLIEAKKTGLPNFLHELQIGLACCGARGPEDYNKNSFEVPASCYSKENKIYQTGCGKAIAVFLEKQSLKIGLLTLGIVVAQVVSIALSIFLYCKL